MSAEWVMTFVMVACQFVIVMFCWRKPKWMAVAIGGWFLMNILTEVLGAVSGTRATP